MSLVPLLPDTAPFTPEQRAWLNGFLAGVFSRAVAGVAASGPASPPPAAALRPLTILFGSQTGTAESLAKKAAREAGKRGFAATVLDMAQADLARLAGETNLLVITSTYGDGEPPDNAKALHAALKSQLPALGGPPAAPTSPAPGTPPPSPSPQPPASHPPLSAVRFSVCALGDTNYAQFCQCGKDLDAWLERLGATRVTPRADCDLDYDARFTAWLDASLAALAAGAPGDQDHVAGAGSGQPDLVERNPGVASPVATPLVPPQPPPVPPAAFSRRNPFPAPVLTVGTLNAPGSAKEVNHVEFSLDGSGLAYEAGDALGVFPQNCPDLVNELVGALGCDGEEAVPAPDGSTTSLRHALTACYDVTRPTPELIARALAVAAGGADPGSPGSPGPATDAVHVIDLLLAAPTRPAPADFVRLLRKLQPRLYSISSSPRAHPGQVHLTVGALRYDLAGRPRKGVCSTFLAERARAAGRVGVFVHANQAFRPPADGATPMIMVGPGTGIAPFRAFLEERQATGATGRNWLFFGDQREATDFLYRDQLLALRRDGVLTRLDLAWSRDQAAKVYVQHRLLEHAGEVFAWLEAGAHFYVCGDASRMAKDVDAALHQVIATAGGKSAEEAAAYVQALRTAKRYQRDVY